MKRPLACVALVSLFVTVCLAQFKDPAPEFRVRSLSGKELALSNLRGNVVVLYFWFVGCEPCRVEMQKLNQMVKEFAGKNVIFISFAPDTEEELRDFLKETKFDYEVVAKASDVARGFRVIRTPWHIVIDKEGQIVRERRGAVDDPGKELGEMIKSLL